MNRAFYILSIVVAIILPLGLLTILFGINVGSIPGTESPRGFCIVTVFLVVLAIVLLAWLKKSNGDESDHEGNAIEGSRWAGHRRI